MWADTEKRRVLGVATRLFAELGFDNTTIGLIAQAADVDPQSMIAQLGEKPELYRQVMLQAHHAEQEVLVAAVARFTPTTEGLIELADAYLDFNLEHPHVLALWIHRWMGDAADVADLEELYARPLANLVTGAVRRLVPGDVDADHLIWTIVWCVYGFLAGGMQETGPGPDRPSGPHLDHVGDPTAQRRFRAHLHTLIRRMTAPTPPHPLASA
ncbi:TetR/AcrR family transcriptional regulator [Nonomuraea sp. LPB2021202275-12-8]|uniref:TetR/AcrR family transcriptional regulator n=1 Tax=Nonomuraea sp. LPB2021202275-12-8 TaxID=3120159 RepID=UPI00300CC1E8